ncbi:agmatinase [Gallicola sp. Sow4_E12]|uniref:agmatinase n=1 Tax=Gallicola sp. Sow4_E12 TaxID=3438785 RepID=UPI003F931984
MTEKKIKQPATAFASPRFVNTGNFMRMQRFEGAEGLDFAIYGIPFDTASSYRSGARFGPQGIRNISVMMKANNPVHEVNILDYLKGGDLGDVNVVPGYIHPTYDAIEEFASAIIEAGALPIALGGDHSITLGELRAIAKKHGPVSLLHFDSHADINDEVFGEKYNHGTPFRRAIEEGLIDPHKSVQIGMRGSIYDAGEFKLAKDLGLTLIPTHKVREMGIAKTIEKAREVIGDNKTFLTFDIDFIDPAYAPATGTPEVGGYTSLEGIEMIRRLKGLNFVGMDIVEVAPPYDHAEVTSLLAANLVFEFLSILAINKKEQQNNG